MKKIKTTDNHLDDLISRSDNPIKALGKAATNDKNYFTQPN